MARGKILLYSQNDGRGCVRYNDFPYDFTIRQWHGHAAPTLNAIVDVEILDGALVSINEVPESVLLHEKAGEAGDALKKFADQCVKYWRVLVASVGLVTVIAQIVYVVSLFGLPVASFHFLWIQGSASLYDLLSNPLVNMSGLYMWCLYASCAVVLVPAFVKDRKSWLALLLPLLLLLIVGHEVHSKLREMNADNEWFGRGAIDGIRQMVTFEIGLYTIVASSVVLAFQGVRNFLVRG
jgi:hypothetical protein